MLDILLSLEYMKIKFLYSPISGWSAGEYLCGVIS